MHAVVRVPREGHRRVRDSHHCPSPSDYNDNFLCDNELLYESHMRAEQCPELLAMTSCLQSNLAVVEAEATMVVR